MIIEKRERLFGYGWHGMIPPQFLLANRRFRGVVLDPPNFNPGSWRGAGNVLIDYDTQEFWLTTRPRNATNRGYAFEVYRSHDGEDFKLVASLDKGTVGSMADLPMKSIEGQQLLRDPSTGRYHLYLAVDIGPGWDTLLLTADDPAGPWSAHGIVIRRGKGYDSREARDAVIDIVDGRYFALYKANDGTKVGVGFATSNDGLNWSKHGVFKLDEELPYILLCGNICTGSMGPVFVGFKTTTRVKGAAVTNTFAAYMIDYRNMKLEPLFSGLWTPLSPYERKDYPVHSYIDTVYDPFKGRVLIYVEAIDPVHSKEVGLNLEVNRLILYEVPL